MDIYVYFEGGGQTAEGKAQLRQGMDAFLASLKDLARQRRWRWQLIPCEGRGQTWNAFQNALQVHADSISLLLVDSEDPITAPDPKQHLAQRDNWPMAGMDVNRVHLMAQCMETWIVADPEALAAHYKQGFNTNALPRRQNLEEEAKPAVYRALESATRQTQKGAYVKIKHAAAILPKLDVGKVKERCPHARRFFDTVTGLLNA
ncbi:MAG: DUF4276 family protein [Verrucomicrobia bacterium]|nr:DUF4276 family protein [Verrucomicrobiota bacterium]